MTSGKVAALIAVCAVAAYAATGIPVSRSAARMGVHEDSLHPGPDSARIATLLDGLATTDRLVCEMVADQIGNFWWDDHDDGLGAFSDAPPALRTAKDSLHGSVRQPQGIALLAARLKADDPCVRRVAGKLLGHSAIATERLIALMDDTSPRVREAAAFAIGEGDRHGAHGALGARLVGRDEALAAMSAWALGELQDSASVPALLRAARSANTRVRIGVIRALGEIKDESTVTEVERAVRDDQPSVRRAAVDALGQIGVERTAPILASALADSDARVRYAAAAALGELHDLRRAPEALVRAASSNDARLAELAANALAEIKDPATIDVMIRLLSHANRDIRRRAVEALGNMGSQKAIPGLLRALKDSDAEVRRAAAEALGELREG